MPEISCKAHPEYERSASFDTCLANCNQRVNAASLIQIRQILSSTRGIGDPRTTKSVMRRD
jgi:hypothetical protein